MAEYSETNRIPIRYLGCQEGINLSSEDHIAPLFLAIRKKLLYWNAAKLSLASWVVVANQVLLAPCGTFCRLGCVHVRLYHKYKGLLEISFGDLKMVHM